MRARASNECQNSAIFSDWLFLVANLRIQKCDDDDGTQKTAKKREMK